MALERQIDFTGGLNTRVPAHKLPENMVQAAINTDFTHGDVRPDIGIGGDGGGNYQAQSNEPAASGNSSAPAASLPEDDDVPF